MDFVFRQFSHSGCSVVITILILNNFFPQIGDSIKSFAVYAAFHLCIYYPSKLQIAFQKMMRNVHLFKAPTEPPHHHHLHSSIRFITFDDEKKQIIETNDPTDDADVDAADMVTKRVDEGSNIVKICLLYEDDDFEENDQQQQQNEIKDDDISTSTSSSSSSSSLLLEYEFLSLFISFPKESRSAKEFKLAYPEKFQKNTIITWYAFGNKIDRNVVRYIFHHLYNEFLPKTVQYTLTILDQDCKLLQINEEKTILFDSTTTYKIF